MQKECSWPADLIFLTRVTQEHGQRRATPLQERDDAEKEKEEARVVLPRKSRGSLLFGGVVSRELRETPRARASDVSVCELSRFSPGEEKTNEARLDTSENLEE